MSARRHGSAVGNSRGSLNLYGRRHSVTDGSAGSGLTGRRGSDGVHEEHRDDQREARAAAMHTDHTEDSADSQVPVTPTSTIGRVRGQRSGDLTKSAGVATLQAGAIALTATTNAYDDDRDLADRGSDDTQRLARRAARGRSSLRDRPTGRPGARTGGRTTARGAVLGKKSAVSAAGKTGRVAVSGAAPRTLVAHRAQQLVASTAAGTKAVLAALASTTGGTALVVVTTIVIAVALIVSLFSWIPGIGANQQAANVGHHYSGVVGDDYPYKGRPYNEMSPLGYAYGNCTDFVAWRLNRDSGTMQEPWSLAWIDMTPLGGHGKDWGLDGNLPGWVDTDTPVPGDIFSVPAGVTAWGGSGGPYGHVGYVGEVREDGMVTLENYGNNRYFVFSATLNEVQSGIAAGQVTFKHNPANTPESRDQTFSGDLITPAGAQSYALARFREYDWNIDDQGVCLENLWNGESNWRWDAENPSSGAYGIPQAWPADKMKSHGDDWRSNPATQIDWGLDYVYERYGTPCDAYAFWNAQNPHWY